MECRQIRKNICRVASIQPTTLVSISDQFIKVVEALRLVPGKSFDHETSTTRCLFEVNLVLRIDAGEMPKENIAGLCSKTRLLRRDYLKEAKTSLRGIVKATIGDHCGFELCAVPQDQ